MIDEILQIHAKAAGFLHEAKVQEFLRKEADMLRLYSKEESYALRYSQEARQHEVKRDAFMSSYFVTMEQVKEIIWQ